MKKIIIFSLLAYLFSCKEEHTPCKGNNLVIPVSLNLIVLDKNGKNLINEKTSTALIYYLDNGRKFYTNANNSALIKKFGDSTNYKYYYGDLGIAFTSTSDIKTFYFDFAGKVDTIYLDNQKNPKYNPCGSGEMLYIQKECTFNGKEWEHTEAVIPPVYIVRR